MIDITLSGRTRFYTRIKTFKRITPGHYTVTNTNDHEFTIKDGHTMGGRRSDWWLEDGGKLINNVIPCTSIRDALNLIENL